MPDSERRAVVDQLARGRGEVPDVGRAATLVVDHRDLVPLGAEPEHRAHEVVSRLAEEPRRADDPRTLAGGRLPLELRAAVDGEWGRRVRLDVRCALRPVEHVVGRERHERRAERGRVRRASDVRSRRGLRIVFGAVDVRPRRSVEHEVRGPRQRRGLEAHVPGRPGQCEHLVAGERLRERAAQLAARPRDQGTASRAERIGVVVLHRWATRGSFHGTPCSSGSSGSYSSVTW